MDTQQPRNYSILFMINYPDNVGYAVGKLIDVFMLSAITAGYKREHIYFSFSFINVSDVKNVVKISYGDPKDMAVLSRFIDSHHIDVVFAFDLNYPSRVIDAIRQVRVSKVIAYWGAPISSVNSGVKLWIKKMEWYIRKNKPDYFVFESEAMRMTAISGRGIPPKNTKVIYLGADTDKYIPANGKDYIYDAFGLQKERSIIFYSGHMEERKGVHVIIRAAIELVDFRHVSNIHFVLCGNRVGEERRFLKMLDGTKAAGHVTFGGYRDDMPELMRSSTVGVIASTGWDSFTMSSIEMMASGLPLVVSRLQGLSETVEENVNGLYFEPGDYMSLSSCITDLIDNEEKLKKFAGASRSRALEKFSRIRQIEKLSELLSLHY